MLVKVRELESLYQAEFEADVAFDAAMDALQVGDRKDSVVLPLSNQTATGQMCHNQQTKVKTGLIRIPSTWVCDQILNCVLKSLGKANPKRHI